MAPRPSISKRRRFDLFKRDNFVCQYCGAHPPQAILHLDHIKPIAEGGDSSDDNLITSCETCNLGKGAAPLTFVPQSLGEKAKDVSEREEQLRGYYDIIEARRDRIEEEAWRIAEMFDPVCRKDGFRRDWLLSIKRFIDRLGYHDVLDAMEVANAKMPWSNKKAFSYFCGVCWNKIRSQSDNG